MPRARATESSCRWQTSFRWQLARTSGRASSGPATSGRAGSGVDCHHLAIRQADVDWQVWVENSQTPVPRKLVITTKTEPTEPQYMATLDWEFAPRMDDSLFAFTPPATAARIVFARAKDREQTPTKP